MSLLRFRAPGTSERVQVSVITLTTSGGKGAIADPISFPGGQSLICST